MRPILPIALLTVALLAIGATPASWEPSPALQLDLASNRDVIPPESVDGDDDGYLNFADCNDDDAAVNNGAVESANGIDDDCDGVIDNGFDTTIDWPKVEFVTTLFPKAQVPAPADWAGIRSAPRLVYTGDSFAAVWLTGRSLRFARFEITDDPLDPIRLLGESPSVLKTDVFAHDLAWTGTRFGVVYEDRSGTTPVVMLMMLDAKGVRLRDEDTFIAASAQTPKIAWGQDRFGIVWTVDGGCAGDCLRFQRFDIDGVGLGNVEILDNSGLQAAIAFSGTAIELDPTRFDPHEGRFGIVYQAYYGLVATADVILTSRPREPFGPTYEQLVNDPGHDVPSLGPLPSIAGNAAGFMVGWHVEEGGKGGACTRSFSLDALTPVQEFEPDLDAGRRSRVIWTGSEYVLVNENAVGSYPTAMDVHFRRIDPSANSHLAAGWGPWREVNLGAFTPGISSNTPDIARAPGGFGVVWVEREGPTTLRGRLLFAFLKHR